MIMQVEFVARLDISEAADQTDLLLFGNWRKKRCQEQRDMWESL